MTKTLSSLLAILTFLIGVAVGYEPGHYFGTKDGVTIEKSKTSNTSLIATDNAAKAKETIKDDTRKLTDPALITDMRSNGWLRD